MPFVNNTQNSNTPAIIAGTGAAATILAANPARVGFSIQNVGTTAAYILFGSGASASVYHFALKAGTGANDGLGGLIQFFDGTIYDGIVTMFGDSNAKVVVCELAP